MKRFRSIPLSIILLLFFTVFPERCSRQSPAGGTLSLENWPKGELEKYTALNKTADRPHPLAEGQKAMIVGTTGALAIRAGLEALKQGGSAADAAITTALTQVCLAAGSWVSYAGFTTMVFYEASTGKVTTLNAAYNTLQAENDPLSIPPSGTPSGRSTLVPGFVAGLQAAHQRFGKIAFAKLFEPAITLAENGFLIYPLLASFLDQKKETLARLPETKKIFTGESGEFYKEGDLFKQPQLAATLRKIAALGADYIYRGEWAKKFVDAVRREGGKITLKDLEDYAVIWGEPISTTYKDFQILTLAPPNAGGTELLEALNLLELANPSQYGHYASSPRALYELIRICRASRILPEFTPDLVKKYFPGGDVSPSSLIKKENAKLVWEMVQKPDWKIMVQEAFDGVKKAAAAKKSAGKSLKNPGHSDALAVVDEYGNVAVLLHTINTSRWGTTGLFVDGISIPDSACFQQQAIAKAGPGVRLPDITDPLLVLKNGKFFLASNTIGSALTEITLQNLVNSLDFGMDPKTSADTINFLRTIWSLEDFTKQVFGEGEFSAEMLEGLRALGLELKIAPKKELGGGRSWWVGLRRDPKTGLLQGGGTRDFNGCALGY